MKLCDNARLALNDLFHFGTYYWGLQLEEKPHRWMCDELMATLADEATPHLLMDVPRGCYKTSIVTAGSVLQQLRQIFLYDNVYHRIMYASATLGLGEAFLLLIENVLRSGGHDGRITKDFGKLWKEPDKKNRRSSGQKDGIVLAPRMRAGEIASVRDPSFFIASIRKPRIGFHADGAILDDLNDDLNTATPEQRKKTQEFYKQIYPIIASTDRTGHAAHVWMTCTPWHDDDVRGMIIREEAQKEVSRTTYLSPWRMVRASAHMPDGSLFFPTKLSEDALTGLRDSMGSVDYHKAYEGEVVPEGEELAREDQIHYVSRDKFPPLRWGRITVDPNQHNEARSLGCYSAISVGGYDEWAKLYIVDIRASRDWDTKDLINELFRVQTEFPGWPIFIEDSHMTHFDHAINLEYVNRLGREEALAAESPNYKPRTINRPRLNWTSPHKGMSKYEKWQGLKPRFQSGSIFFASEIDLAIKQELENELTRGRSARFKDILDSLAMMENGITPRYKASGRPEKVPTGGTPDEGLSSRTISFASQFPGMVE